MPEALLLCACPCGCANSTSIPNAGSAALARHARCDACGQPEHLATNPGHLARGADDETSPLLRPITATYQPTPEEAAATANALLESRREIWRQQWRKWQEGLPEKFRDAETQNPQVLERLKRIHDGKAGVAGLAIVGDIGRGKCLTGDALIHDPTTGLRARLEDVVLKPGHDHVMTVHPDGRLAIAPIAAKVDTGHKETLRFRLGSGREVTVTPEHPFLTLEGWRRADHIRPGERVATAARLPEPTLPVRQTEEALFHLAALVAGNGSNETRITLSSAALSSAPLSSAAPAGVESTRGCEQARLSGLLAMPAADLRIPDEVYRLPSEQLAAFLSLLWTRAEESVQRAAIIVQSHGLALDLQHLLLRFAIPSRIHSQQAHEGAAAPSAWQLSVLEEGLGAFTEVIATGEEKAGALDRLLPRGHHRGGGPRDDTQDSGAPPRTEDLWWDLVVSIDPAGVQRVFDLSIAATHSFVANDIIVHNTWLAVAYANQAIRAGYFKPSEVLFGSESELLAAAANSSFGEVEKALRRIVSGRYRMIIIDDVGRGTWLRDDMRAKVFSLVLDKFWSDNLVVVITSNLARDGLAEYVGEGAMDRLRSMTGYGGIVLDSEHMRRKVTEEMLNKGA